MLPQLSFAKDQTLKALIDDYTYSLSVEWDQKDQAFAESQNEKFRLEMRSLIEAGLSKKEILEAFKSVDPQRLESELMLVDLSNPVAVANFISMKKASAYSSGASWSGKIPTAVYVASIMAAVITLAIILTVNKAPGSSCVEYNNSCSEKCETRNGSTVCYDYCDTGCKVYQ
jgi:hypothetical protein